MIRRLFRKISLFLAKRPITYLSISLIVSGIYFFQVGLQSQPQTAAAVCYFGYLQEKELNDLEILQQNYQNLGRYMSPIELVRLQNLIDGLRYILPIDRRNCLGRRELEQNHAEYSVLGKIFELDKVSGYPESERSAIYSKAHVPSNGPRSMMEELQVLRVIRDKPSMYHCKDDFNPVGCSPISKP